MKWPRRTALIALLCCVANSRVCARSRTAAAAAAAAAPLSSHVSNYLTSFGYLPQPAPGTENLRSENSLRLAVKRLQRFAGLPPTGAIDDATKRLLETKRCGVPDYQYVNGRRHRRYALQGAKWAHSDLKYHVEEATTRLGPGRVRRIVHDALQQWAAASGLTFAPTSRAADADIIVRFVTRAHGDGYPFDGPDIVLAHAFFPGAGQGGDAHFDNDEKWTAENNGNPYSEEISLFSVAAHEFGHSLGLSHSNVENSLMYPYYQYVTVGNTLHDDDVRAIQQLYGPGERVAAGRSDATVRRTTDAIPTSTFSTTHIPPPESPPPNICNTSIDAISRIRNEIFVFKGDHFWRFDELGYLFEQPVLISRFWREINTPVDAIYERRSTDTVVIFTGRQVWKYRANRLLSGYPKTLANLGLPANISKVDAAFVGQWNPRRHKTFIFAGQRYWALNEASGRVFAGYPRSVQLNWRGVPLAIDGSFTNDRGTTFFFEGRRVYRFNDFLGRVDNGYPIKSSDFWVHCSGAMRIRYDYQRSAAAIAPVQIVAVVLSCIIVIVARFNAP